MSTRTNIDFFKYIYYPCFIKSKNYCNGILNMFNNKNRFYSVLNPKYSRLCSQIYDRNILLLKTNIDFITLFNMVNIAYNKDKLIDKDFFKDIIQYMFKVHGLNQGICLNEIKKRYISSYTSVEERMYFRIELYKHGWTVHQIENYIHKYLLKEPFSEECITYKYIYMFEDLMTILNIESKKNVKQLGRPPLPESLKKCIKNINKIKVKQNMDQIYNEVKLYNKYKKYLLTKEEKDIIISLLRLKKGQEELINKISNLIG